MSNNEVPFPDSYWVIPEKFLAGEYPGSTDERMMEHKIKRLLGIGVNHIIDLTQENEARPYFPTISEEASQLGIDFTYERRPIIDFYIPNEAEMKETLDALDQALNNHKVVYVHCMGGIGRTGTVVGCYLVRHGMRAEEALETITRLRKDVPDWWHPSPETNTQRDFVLHWQEKDLPEA